MGPAKNRLSEDELRVQKIPKPKKTEETAAATTSRNESGLLAREALPECGKSIDVGNVKSTEDDIIICVPCPVCNVYVPENAINSHLDSCLM